MVQVAMQWLGEIRSHSGERKTVGLADEVVERFLGTHAGLAEAIEEAWQAHRAYRAEDPDVFAGSEADLVKELQEGLINFYTAPTINPYVALAARGPWVVTTHGAVVHDNGGYGMLGAGHAPPAVLESLARPWVMANVMTASLSQRRLVERLRREIGQTRGECPYPRFICMNSGSESVTVAMRISDVNAMRHTAPGGRFEGRPAVFVALRGAFHGRTDRPAQVSASTLPRYREVLKSFAERDNVLLVTPNDLHGLQRAFDDADAEGLYVEAMFIEPVQGEGNPGEEITRPFYDLARRLTRERDALLIVDSIQAGLRGTGFLSMVDYPGFEDSEPPDLETFSKALNAGQYPLSVLAVGEWAADLYVGGIYGNTMTTNPRALEVACAVLDQITPALRENIRVRGAELVSKLEGLMLEFPGLVQGVRGTGLLAAVEIDPEQARVVGFDGLETWCRLHGLGVIHGGVNALRFTPHFAITSEELDLIVDVVRQALRSRVGIEALLEPARVLEPVEAGRN